MERVTGDFILPVLPLPQGIAQCQNRTSWPGIFPVGESGEYVNECPASPVCGMPPKRPTSFLPHPQYQVVTCMTGKTAVGAQGRMYQRAADPADSFVDCIRKPIHEVWGDASPVDLYNWPQLPSPPTLHVPYPCSSPQGPHSRPASVYVPEVVRMNFCRE